MDYLLHILQTIHWKQLFFALAILLVGYLLAKKTSQLVELAVKKRFSKHQRLLLGRIVFYALFLLFVISSLQEIGFNLTLLLGTAGLFTVGLSFASQTAASNLISGIFLLFERPFKVGDIIAIKDSKGTVEAMDWLSTKIKTGDNRLIRIPNESLIKTEIVNLSVYSNKRDEIVLNIAAGQDIAAIKSLLQSLCSENSNILPKPESKVLLSQLKDGGDMEFKVLYWTKNDLAGLKDELLTAIMKALEANKISFASNVPKGTN